MTKPRAMLAGDDPSADPLLSCLAAIRAPPRELETAPRTADGSRLLCKRFCRGDGGSCARPDCPDAHVPIAQRQTCWMFDRYGVCAREEARRADPKAPRCWFPHPVPPPAAHHIALQVEVGMSDRVVSRCRELLGADAVVGAARADLSRNGDVLVLVTAGHRGVANAARILADDHHLAARIKRAYATGTSDDAADRNGDRRNERGRDEGILFADASVVGDDADALDAALREKLASLVDAALLRRRKGPLPRRSGPRSMLPAAASRRRSRGSSPEPPGRERRRPAGGRRARGWTTRRTRWTSSPCEAARTRHRVEPRPDSSELPQGLADGRGRGGAEEADRRRRDVPRVSQDRGGDVPRGGGDRANVAVRRRGAAPGGLDAVAVRSAGRRVGGRGVRGGPRGARGVRARSVATQRDAPEDAGRRRGRDG